MADVDIQMAGIIKPKYDKRRKGFVFKTTDEKSGSVEILVKTEDEQDAINQLKDMLSAQKEKEDAEKVAEEESKKTTHSFAEGGMEDGGLKDEGGTVDPVSGNEVPSGSNQKEVRDDIPAQLSEGEFVFPADVVRYIGLENLMELRSKAKQGLAKMEAMGQMGNSEEATMDDDGEYEGEIDELIENFDPNNPETMSFAEGGVVHAQQGSFVPGMPQQQFSYGFMPPQQQGAQAPVYPQAPDYTQFVSRPAQVAATGAPAQVEDKQYIGPNGELITIRFMNGKAQQEIPAGFKVYKPEEVKPEVATPTVQQPTGGDSGGDREREEEQRREYATYLTELNTLSKFDEEFAKWANETFPNQMKAAGAMVIDPKTGLPSFPTMSFADSMKGLFSGEQYSALKEGFKGFTGQNETDKAYERVANALGTKLDFYESKGLFGETRFDKERMLEDLNTWSNTSDSDREGISSVADRLSKSTGIDINPIGEQARMLAEQERGLTWDTEDDSTSIETRGQDITAEVREALAQQRDDSSSDDRDSEDSGTGTGSASAAGGEDTEAIGSFSKGGAVQQTQRALKSSRKK
jgi:hypothetical protein